MASLDVFNKSAFEMMELTNSINTLPYKPRMLGALGIFKENPVRTTKVFIERKQNRLSLIATANRGTVKDVHETIPRTARGFNIPHVPKFGSLLADDVQNIRAFGSETELQAVASAVNDKLQEMKDDHEVTQEFHRVGALKGIVLDADNSTVIYNFFTEFGFQQSVVDFVGTVSSFSTVATSVIRTIANNLGNESFESIVALCGDAYFDAVVGHSSMQSAYDRWRDGEFKRMSHLGPAWYSAATAGFSYQNILFINYRGTIDDVVFVPSNEAYYFPTGINNFLEEIIGPADFMETVNTKGKRFYAKQEPLPFNKGVKLHTQSNVLAMCKRPQLVIKSTYTSGSSSSSSA